MLDTTAYHVVHLERLPLGTTYPGVVEHVQRLMHRAPLMPTDTLVLDFTGCGRPVYDIFVSRGMNPIGVSITSGDSVTCNGLTYGVPKALLISRVTALLHEGRLKIAKELTDAAALVEELQAFKATVTESGRWTFGARAGKHDDLVLALAIAIWRACNGGISHAGLLGYVDQQIGIAAQTKYFIGLDLGQSQDPTAICIVARQRPAQPAQERQPLRDGCIITDLSSILL